MNRLKCHQGYIFADAAQRLCGSACIHKLHRHVSGTEIKQLLGERLKTYLFIYYYLQNILFIVVPDSSYAL